MGYQLKFEHRQQVLMLGGLFTAGNLEIAVLNSRDSVTLHLYFGADLYSIHVLAIMR